MEGVIGFIFQRILSPTRPNKDWTKYSLSILTNYPCMSPSNTDHRQNALAHAHWDGFQKNKLLSHSYIAPW